jgi:hypothetical protein
MKSNLEIKSSAEEKPTVVQRAVNLLYLSAAISVACFLIECSFPSPVDLGGPIFGFLIGLAFAVWQIYYIDQGRNWARITFLVLFLVSIPMYVSSLSRMFKLSLLLDGLSVANFIIDIFALAFLFSRQARPWFRSGKSDAPSSEP